MYRLIEIGRQVSREGAKDGIKVIGDFSGA